MAEYHRRSIRLPSFDYATPGAYFITLITHQRACIFGEIKDGFITLSPFGQVATACWNEIPDHFPSAIIDSLVVMPDHIHGIIVLEEEPRKGTACRALTEMREQFSKPIAGSIPTIIRSYKAAVTRQINLLRKTHAAPVWHRNYYEHVIRDEADWLTHRNYIEQNPQRWGEDEVFLNNNGQGMQ